VGEQAAAGSGSLKDRLFIAFAAVMVLALIAGPAGYLYFRKNVAEKQPEAPVKASAGEVQSGAEVSYPANVQARHIVTVAAPVEGTLDSLDVEVGSDVFEGQILGRIKNGGLEAERDRAIEELESAQSRLNNLESALIAARLESSRAAADASRARSEYDRTQRVHVREQNLYKEGATARLKMEKAAKDYESSQKEFEALNELARQASERVGAIVKDIELARRAVEEKTAASEQARDGLAAAELHSPVDGVFLAARAKAGDEVNLGMEDLFQIGVDLQEMEITIEPEPPVLAKLKVGLPALVQILDHSRDAVEGEIAAIEGDRVKVHFTSPDVAVKPGMAGVVKLRVP
jgi:multidrug resistance efflux pump